MMVASMKFYPIFLNVSGKRAVVVGGGPVAVRKAKGLIEAGAQVIVIAPDLSANLPVGWRKRRYRAGDLKGATLAFAATNDRAVNARVRSEANVLGIPVAAGVLYPFFGLLLSPIIAGAAMSLSSVSVISNALRLRKVKL